METLGKVVTFLVLMSVCVWIQAIDAAHCPPPNWIKPTKTCISDKECYPGLCCPDYKGRKSCALPQAHKPALKDEGFNSRKYCKGLNCIRRKTQKKMKMICEPDLVTQRMHCWEV